MGGNYKNGYNVFCEYLTNDGYHPNDLGYQKVA
jgi:hypothetical protein